MDIFQYYPTPKELAQKAFSLFKNKSITRMLEPSAGLGHLLEAVDHPTRRSGRVDVCEIDFEKHPVLREKGYKLIGNDFLELENGSFYSHVFMNPPFHSGDKHVLHAWDILYDGEIVAILNAETIRNQCSKERVQLCKLIERHGEVHFVGQAFKDAGRSTDVDVALVWLKKEADMSGIMQGWFDDLAQDKTRPGGFYAPEFNELMAPNSFVENAVAAFNAATKAAKELALAQAKSAHYTTMLGKTLGEQTNNRSCDAQSLSTEFVQNSFFEAYSEIKDRAWTRILFSTEVLNKTSSSVRSNIYAEFNKVKNLEFTARNIYGFLCGLAEKQGEIQKDMIFSVFDMISMYHTDNIVFYRGWKSNDKHRTAARRIKKTRFILPGFRDYFSGRFEHSSLERLADMDKAFALLDGLEAPSYGLVRAFEERFADLKAGKRVSTSYFDVRFYPGVGTVHFFPNGTKMIDRMNRFVGKRRGWLPETESMASKEYWSHYEGAEKFDKEVVSEVRKSQKGRYGVNAFLLATNSVRCANRKEDYEDACNKINSAIDEVLKKKGIDVQVMLEAQSEDSLKPPLAAKNSTLSLPFDEKLAA